MGQLANCPQCGRLFVKGIQDLCDSCYKEEEEIFDTVYHFISERKNRLATLTEICDATGVEERTVTRFIKEGRLHLANLPNLGYPCESCGTMIREGRICIECTKKFQEGLDQQEREERLLQRKK